MLDSLLSLSDNPMWLVVALMLSTLMLEDLAIIGAALMAASERIAPGLAFAAVCAGMMLGDTALYLFGRAAHHWPWLQKKLQHPMIQRQIVPLQKSPWHQLVLIRCMPGLRTFGYIACGLARVPATPFTLANLVSIVAWAAVLFYVSYSLGQEYAETMHEWLWWALPLALVLFIFGQRKLRQNIES